MLSNVFIRCLTSVRPIYNYQQQFLRLLSTTETMSNESVGSNRETGVVKRFSKEKGYGFISKSSDGTDCFVHFKNINTSGFKTLEQGQEVEFTIAQGEKGMEARDVSVLSTGTGRMSFMDDSSNNNSTSSRFGFRGSARNQSPSAFKFGGDRSDKFQSTEQDSTSPRKSFNFRTGMTSSNTDNLFSTRRTQLDGDKQRETGSVKRWTDGRGFGFIRRTNGGPDLFCHIRSLTNGVQSLEEGQTVEFTTQQTDKGEEARDVTILNDDTVTPQQRQSTPTVISGERHTGTVKRWIPDKGYGFVRRSDDGSDVFVHLRELTDGSTSLEEGQTVEFNITKGDKGDMAQNVTVHTEN